MPLRLPRLFPAPLHERVLLELLHAGRITLPGHVDDQQDHGHGEEEGHAARDDLVEGHVLVFRLHRGRRDVCRRAGHRRSGLVAFQFGNGGFGDDHGSLGGFGRLVGPFSSHHLDFSTDVVGFHGVTHLLALDVFGACTDHGALLISLEILKPIKQGANASSTFPHIPGQSDGDERDPRVDGLLGDVGEFVGIQVQLLQVGQALEGAGLYPCDVVAR